MEQNSRLRRLVAAAGVYLACAILFASVAGRERLTEHTPFNHYAQLADAWIHGRQDLANGPPGYAQGNDFAQFEGKTYISFPPFPALLMVPWVALAGGPERFQDGQFVIVWLAGIGPALLFLVLEQLRQTGRSGRSEGDNLLLAGLLAIGTPYFFTAVEGTVWFAAHVVGLAALTGFVLASLGGRFALLAGMCLAAGWMTRPAMLLVAPFFLYEAARAAAGNAAGGPLLQEPSLRTLLSREVLLSRRVLGSVALFSAPILFSFALASWMNYTRFRNPSPFAFGHEYLSVVWKGRMDRWGLFNFHYLSKNLGAMLTILPWLPPKGAVGTPPLQINEHGLALWFTTPIYLWLLWPRRWTTLHSVLALAAAGPCILDLLYQNSGWRQFGYRFSNDYSPLLFMLLALGDRSVKKPLFLAAALWSVGWNLFGAMTFDRGGTLDRFYYREGTQTILYQPD